MIKKSEIADMNFKASVITMVQKVKGKDSHNGRTEKESQQRNRNYV